MNTNKYDRKLNMNMNQLSNLTNTLDFANTTKNGNLKEMMETLSQFQTIFDNASNKIPEHQEPMDLNAYFDMNRYRDGKLKDDDMMTVSVKEKDGYRAVFVTLGDLKEYLMRK